jgi:hypothetical protein
MFKLGRAIFGRHQHCDVARACRRMNLDGKSRVHLGGERVPIRMINESFGHGLSGLSKRNLREICDLSQDCQ